MLTKWNNECTDAGADAGQMDNEYSDFPPLLLADADYME
jgi:hypothetical protein